MKKSLKQSFSLILTMAMPLCWMPAVDSYAESGVGAIGNEPAVAVQNEETETDPQSTDEKGAASEKDAAEESVTEETVEETAKDAAVHLLSAGNVLDRDADVASIVSSMTTEQKIAQVFMMDCRYWGSEGTNLVGMTRLPADYAQLISDYQFGGMIYYDMNIQDTAETLQLTKDMQAAVMEKGGLPMLIATDQEGGIVYRLGSGTGLPGNMALAATGDTSNAKTSGQIVGRELSAVGINTTLAPVMDVNSNASNPIIGVRSFSDDAETVGDFGKAFISGLNEYDIIGSAKHFPGHGDTSTDSHYGLPLVDKSKAELEATEFKPFKAAINSGIDMIMTAHILYPQIDNTKILSEKTGKAEKRPATMSKTILTYILRGEMGYDGVVITDSMDMAGVADFYTESQAAYEALKAGADIILVPFPGTYTVKEKDKDPVTYAYSLNEYKAKLDEVIEYINDKVEASPSDMDRLNEAVMRVLTLKKNKGIMDYSPDDYTPEKALAEVGSAENRAHEREMAAKAVTVIRNKNNVLPYRASENTNVLMLAPYGNELAQMVMGLNRAKEAGIMPASLTVDAYNFYGESTISDELQSKLEKADLVVINSEMYNANDMSYAAWRSQLTKSVTQVCKFAGKKSVVMSVNTPYDVQMYPAADAVIAVYSWKGSDMSVTQDLLDGKITADKDACGPNITAGSEVIFGVYGASGKLPVNIPKFDISTKEYTEEIVYERGYGITYNKLEPLDPEPEPEPTPAPAPSTDDNSAFDAAYATLGGVYDYTMPVPAKFKATVYKKGVKASWKKFSKKKKAKFKRIEIQVSRTGDFTDAKVRTAKKAVVSKSVGKLKSKKTYYVRARTYKVIGGVKYVSAWSKVRMVKTR